MSRVMLQPRGVATGRGPEHFKRTIRRGLAHAGTFRLGQRVLHVPPRAVFDYLAASGRRAMEVA